MTAPLEACSTPPGGSEKTLWAQRKAPPILQSDGTLRQQTFCLGARQLSLTWTPACIISIYLEPFNMLSYQGFNPRFPQFKEILKLLYGT